MVMVRPGYRRLRKAGLGLFGVPCEAHSHLHSECEVHSHLHSECEAHSHLYSECEAHSHLHSECEAQLFLVAHHPLVVTMMFTFHITKQPTNGSVSAFYISGL